MEIHINFKFCKMVKPNLFEQSKGKMHQQQVGI